MNGATATGLVAMAWAGLVATIGWRRRPRPKPVLDFGVIVTPARTPARSRWRADLFVRSVGRAARRLAGRSADDWADRRLGATVLVGLGALLMSPPVAPVAATVAWAVPWWRRRSTQKAAEDRALAALPEVVDLFVLATGAGLNVSLALAAVAPRAGGEVGAALLVAQRRVSLGERTADALAVVPDLVGDAVRPLVAVLVASDRYGTPLGPELDRLAAEVRLQRRRRAEEAARRLPVKLVFPLVLCSLPAFALLTVVPLLLGAFGSLRQ